MSALDYILDGLEQALELERELGVRTLEIDRALLETRREATSPPFREKESPASFRSGGDAASPLRVAEQPSRLQLVPLVFLHDRPLSPGGVEMMAKIIGALGLSDEQSPVVVEPPIPKARIAVVLGARALKKYFPDIKGEPGQWLKSPGGRDVLVTYSPEYILRFSSVTPAVQKIKQDMWRSLKAVRQRLA